MTFDEYSQYEAPAGRRDELIHGVVILSPSPNRRHQDLCLALYRLLDDVIASDYVVRLDTTVRLGMAEGPRPDVFVIDRARWIAADEHGGYPLGSPQLVVEVKSDSNTWRELIAKKDLFLSSGECLAVWIVDPEERSIHTYQGSTHRAWLSDEAILLPGAIGSGVILVADVFKGIVQ